MDGLARTNGDQEVLDKQERLAALAKTKVKARARGWSLLSKEEILALAFVADVFLDDVDLPKNPKAKPAPPVISET